MLGGAKVVKTKKSVTERPPSKKPAKRTKYAHKFKTVAIKKVVTKKQAASKKEATEEEAESCSNEGNKKKCIKELTFGCPLKKLRWAGLIFMKYTFNAY